MDEDLNSTKNTEINQALKEFEMKSQIQQTPQEKQTAKDNDETSKMAKLVIKYSGGAIKEQKQAEYILLGFVVVAIIVSLLLIFGSGARKVKKNINPETGGEIIPGQISGGI